MKRMGMALFIFAALFSALIAKDDMDRKFEGTLNASGLKYGVDTDGDYQLLFNFDNDRSQTIFIRSGVSMYDALTIREIITPVWFGKKAPNAKTMAMLLENSTAQIIGHWQVENANGAYLVWFCARIDNDIAADKLRAYCSYVAEISDAMEAHLNKTDMF